MKSALRVGLTGGIGSGKSTVCKIFSDLGVPVIDADKIAYELLQPEKPALNKVINIVGNEYVNDSGQLDRRRLRDLIFKNNKIKTKIEAILHPLIYSEIENQAKIITHPYFIICVPLLIETNAVEIVDKILVIDIPEDLQLTRASERDGLNSDEIKNIINNQASSDLRLKAADDVIHNNRDKEYLVEQVKILHDHYRGISRDIIAHSA